MQCTLYHRFRKENGEEFLLPSFICPTVRSAIEMARGIDENAVYVGIKIKY
jgi:hypothetical protein